VWNDAPPVIHVFRVYTAGVLDRKTLDEWVEREKPREVEYADTTKDPIYRRIVTDKWKQVEKLTLAIKLPNERTDDDDLSGAVYTEGVDAYLNALSTGDTTYKSVEGEEYGITGHAYECARHRKVTEGEMLNSAHKGDHIGKGRHTDGKTVVVKEQNRVVAAWPVDKKEMYQDSYIPPLVDKEDLLPLLPIRFIFVTRTNTQCRTHTHTTL
jgi:hypothetical protein